MKMAITHLYNDNFEETIHTAELPVLVDFWATWCGPCRMIAPIIEEISDELDGTLDVCKVDVDDADSVAMQYGIMSIPTIVIFKDGKEMERLVGYRAKDALMQVIQKYL